jgi:putative membrane protein
LEIAMSLKPMIGASLAAMLLTAASGAVAQDAHAKKFISEAMEGNLAEVQMGQLADQNGASAEVKQYGQMLVQDHGSANQKAESVAQQLGVTTPGEPSAAQKAELARMAKLQGAQFDRAFIRAMVADHEKDVRKYQAEAKRKNDPAAAYASETLPTLQHHLQQAQQLQKTVSSSR